MLSYPKKSKERRQLIALLRNAGHFNEFLKGNIRPVYQRKKYTSTTYYPCPNCKGLYSKKFLIRHRNKCLGNTNTIQNSNILSASQTVIACALNTNSTLHKLRVKNEVFDSMKADHISSKNGSFNISFRRAIFKKTQTKTNGSSVFQ